MYLPRRSRFSIPDAEDTKTRYTVSDSEGAIVEMWTEGKYLRYPSGLIHLDNIDCGPLVLPPGGRIEMEAA